MVASFAVAIWEPLWWGFHRPVVNLGWPLPSRRAESMDCVMKQSIHKHSLIYRRGGADTGHNIDQSFLWVRESHLESYHFWNYANLHIKIPNWVCSLLLSCYKAHHTMLLSTGEKGCVTTLITAAKPRRLLFWATLGQAKAQYVFMITQVSFSLENLWSIFFPWESHLGLIGTSPVLF